MNSQLSMSQIVRRIAGLCIASILVTWFSTGVITAHAEPVAAIPTYAISMVLEANGEKLTSHVLAKAGEQISSVSGDWRVEMIVRQGDTLADILLKSKLFTRSCVVVNANIVAHANEEALIKVGNGTDVLSLTLIVYPQS